MAAEQSAVLAARWLLQPLELLHVIGDASDAFFRAKASPDGQALVARCGSGKAIVWNISDGCEPVQELCFMDEEETELGASDIAASILRGRALWSTDGARLAILCSTKCFKIWERDLPRGLFSAVPLEFTIDQQGWPELAWSPDGCWISMWLPPLNRVRRCRSSGGLSVDHGKLWIFDARMTGSDPVELDHGIFQIRGASWSADSRFIIAWCLRHESGESGKVLVWDHRSKSCCELNHGDAHVCHVAWSPVRSEIATVSSDGIARIWDMNAQTVEPLELDTTVKAGLDAQHVSWAPDGTRIVTSSIRAGLRVCGLRHDEVLLFELKYGSATESALSSPASRRLVLSGDQLEPLPPPQVWDLCASKTTPIYLRHEEKVQTEFGKLSMKKQDIIPESPTFETARSWSPDSERIAVVSRATRKHKDVAVAVKVWLWATVCGGAEPVELEGLRDIEVHELSWSWDSLLIIAACVEGTARLFETQKGVALCVLGQPWNIGQTAWSKGTVCARFLPCGRRIVISNRSSHIDADTEESDSVHVFGPELSATAYKTITDLALASSSSALPADPNTALQGAQQLLKALEVWCLDGEQCGLKQMSQALTKCALEQRLRFVSDPEVVAFCANLKPVELALHGAQFEAAAIWGSCEQGEFCGNEYDFAWFLNFAIDMDDPVLLHAAMLFMLSLDRFSVARRHQSLPPVLWPEQDEAGRILLWRGGGFNAAWCSQFARGMRHRIPSYVAMSRDRDRARQHMQAAMSRHEPAIEWCFEINAACVDLLYLGGLLAQVGQEDFLLRPYTVVEVIDVEWQVWIPGEESKGSYQDAGDWQRISYNNPHRITLRVEFDAGLSADKLPIAPWR